MSQYPYPGHACQTQRDLDDYLLVNIRELKNIIVKFKAEVGY
jgi:hypothetical protein